MQEVEIRAGWDAVRAHVADAGGSRLSIGWGQRGTPKDAFGVKWWAEGGEMLDHTYTYRRESGTKVYVTEPYGLRVSERVCEQLAILNAAGWDVDIYASGWWNPGSTLRIEITRRS